MILSSRIPEDSRATPNGMASGGDRPPFWHSLRWRIPASFGTLIVLILASFLWTVHGEVERTLVGAGAERAEVAARELAGTLSRSMRAVTEGSARLGADAAVREYLVEPAPRTRAAAREALASGMTPGARRYELWDSAGSLVLEIATSGSESSAGIRTFPPGAPPGYLGASRIRASGEFHYFDIVTEIRDSTAPDTPLLGHLRRFGQFTASAGSPVQRLLGQAAVLKVGTVGSNVWTDFATVVEPPPREPLGEIEGEYRAEDGMEWVGAGVPIEGTRWQVWVGYPRTLIVAPMRAFFLRMLTIALVFVGASIAVAAALGSRLTRPLRALAKATEEIASGDYSRRLRTARRDEIGRLSSAFDRMTDRVQDALGALEDSHESTHFALASACIGVWESDLLQDRVSCSESMRLVHGYGADDLPQTREEFLTVVHPDDRDTLADLMAAAVDHGPFDVEYRAEWPDGSIHWVEGKGRVTTDEEGRPASILAVSIDVTEHRGLESQLRQAQKMEAVGHLAGGVAHDFNNLLTAIVGHGNLVLAELPREDHLRENVKEMLSAADSAAGLTRQLLAFSRRQVIQPRVIDPNEVVIGTSKLLGRLIGENIELSRNLEKDLHAVKVDPGQLQQVIMNLAVNARDAMPNGGSLTIRTANADLDVTSDKPLKPGALPAGAYALISVTDTGTGMDAETQAHLFEPFFTTKGPAGGTGLGLATVFGIVKQSGGHIEVRSEPDVGSSFTIYLPATTENVSPSPTAVTPRPVGGGTESILLVEDYGPVRAIARTVLKRIGYDVVAVSSGEEALETLAASGTRPDLILSDVVMPGMTGPELCRQVETIHPDVRVLFTSGYSGDALDRHGVQESAVLFLEKPYTPAALAAKVREALGKVTRAG